jgi:DNA-binding MarR family transcriptional regulator/N-acetylglutamate synthase-like GNAT family acetyltransferase
MDNSNHTRRRCVVGRDLGSRIEAVRRFNRFFTRRIGVLREGLLHSRYSLTEARVLFELANREGLTPSDLSRELGLDPGYLSRTLGRLEEQGLVARVRSHNDGRRRLLSLTPMARMPSPCSTGLSEGGQRRLLEAMRIIEGVLRRDFKFSEPFVLRGHEPGDMGWVVQRHGVLYAREYGWDESFEALVARIIADFVEGYDPARERCWIAELGGERVGCVFVVKGGDAVAKLRLLLVEPEARGLGLGNRLVEECIRFSRNRGYEKLTLWTNSVLDAARHIYEEHGFVLVDEEEHHSFGHDLVGQNWELIL